MAIPSPSTLLNFPAMERRAQLLIHQIVSDCATGPIMLVGVLKGAMRWMALLMHYCPAIHTHRVQYDFIGVRSYRGTQAGELALYLEPDIPLNDRHVVLVEDIVDTGQTAAFLLSYIQQQAPKTLSLCALLDKPSQRAVDVVVNYKGFEVPNHFMVGFGLDYNQQFRGLNYIGYL
jgi:hypoxanthine phosphoribosyltransferase